MAAEIVGAEQVTMPFSTYPKIVHMKRHIAGTHTEAWTKELVWEYQDLRLRIQTVAQTGAFHYNVISARLPAICDKRHNEIKNGSLALIQGRETVFTLDRCENTK